MLTVLCCSDICGEINLAMGLGIEVPVCKPLKPEDPLCLGTSKMLAWDIRCKNGTKSLSHASDLLFSGVVHKMDCFIAKQQGTQDVASAYGQSNRQ